MSITVSLRPPDRVMPVPIGPGGRVAGFGHVGVVVVVESLWMNTQHEWVWVIGLIPSSGQSPFWGAGGSPAIWVLVSIPSWLLSNCEFSMTIAPPELVPE